MTSSASALQNKFNGQENCNSCNLTFDVNTILSINSCTIILYENMKF